MGKKRFKAEQIGLTDGIVFFVSKITHYAVIVLLQQFAAYIHYAIPHRVKIGDISFFMNGLTLNNVEDSSIHKYGSHEPWLSKKIIETLDENDVFCDIGAANGYYTLLLVLSPQTFIRLSHL